MQTISLSFTSNSQLHLDIPKALSSLSPDVCVELNGSAAFIGRADGDSVEEAMFGSSLGNTTVNKSG